MTFTACGNTYTYLKTSGNMAYQDWWDIPDSVYSVYMGELTGCDGEAVPCLPDQCPTNPYLSVYKDSRATFIDAVFYCEGHATMDSNGICIGFTGWDTEYDYATCEAYVGLVTAGSTYDDVYVDARLGDDTNAGNTRNAPVKTYNRALQAVNSGGTIWVVWWEDYIPDFSSETPSTKSFNTTLYVCQ